ncbi:hypothetical protein GCM10027048_19340 [Hymenobacter coalescens]
MLLLAAGLVGSCALRPPQVVPLAVPLAEAQVKTAAEARAIALRWVAQDSSAVRQLRLDEVTVYEEPAWWQVYIRRRANVKPPSVLVAVDKRTGQAQWVPLR